MIFLSLIFPKEDEETLLKKSNSGLQNQVNKFQWNLINGFSLYSELEIINSLPVGSFPIFKDIFLKSKKWKYGDNTNVIEVGGFNLPLIKQFIRYYKVLKILKNKTTKSSSTEVIIYSTYLPYLRAVVKLRKRNLKSTLIVTDLPQYYDFNKTNKFFKLARKINNYLIYRDLEKIDRFVLLTEDMKFPLNVGKRPYIVVEGSIDFNKNSYIPKHNYISTKKIVLYTGGLNVKFGTLDLLKAFHLIDEPEYELWICGSGDAEKDVLDYTKIDKRIKYFGFVSSYKLEGLQKHATILINPRKNSEEFAKYSFPSKTLEYLSLGKPIVMFKLDGIPKEYDHHLYYFKDDSIESMANCIKEICSKPTEELYEKSLKSLNWVMKEKNSKKQAKRILEFIRDNS